MASIFVGARIPPELYQKLETRMAQTGSSKSDVVLEALQTYLSQQVQETSTVQRIVNLEQRLQQLESGLGEFAA